MPHTTLHDDSYELRQDAMDRKYHQAWEDAPESFKKKVAKLDLKAQSDSVSHALPFDEALITVSHVPDMAATIDTEADRMIEKYGAQYEAVIRGVMEDLRVPLAQEIEKNRALLLGRVAGFLIKSEGCNILARAHQLLHAIPMLAEINGYKTMRESARECHVSPEWMKRGRDKWCKVLGIPIPSAGRKSPEAIEKYRKNGLTRHWRNKKFKAAK